LASRTPGVGNLASRLTVDRVRDERQLEALAAAWDNLIDERSLGVVFRSSAWLLPWWNHFSSGKELCVYTVYLGSHLVGVLPAYRVATAFGGRRLRLIGDGVGGSDYLGVIARSDHLEAASEAIARILVSEESDVALDDLEAVDPLVAALEREARTARAAFSRSESDSCPFLSIAEAGDFSDWLRERPSGIRRHRRWLEKRPGFRIDILSSEREIVDALPTLWRLHHARWAHQGGSDAVDSPAVERFHYESARALARRGWARLYMLYVEGAPRAALYGFERGGRFYFYQTGSDPAWGKRSVGTVVLGAAMEDAFARGLAEFDFLRGAHAYKHLYASSSRRLVRLRVASGARGRVLLAVGEGRAVVERLARKRLPPAVVDWIRRHRRQARRWVVTR